MNTLHVDLGAEWRGGQQQVWLLLRGLRSRGHAAELVALGGAPLAAQATAEGFAVHEVAPNLARSHAALVLRRLMGRQRFDVVHAHDAHGLTAAWVAGAHQRTALVAARRVAFPVASPRRYSAAHRVVAVSKCVADIVAAAGVNRSRVAVVHDGVEVPRLPSAEERRQARARWDAEPQTVLIGCVGYFSPEKGQERLIRALPTIRERHPNCRLLLVGEGPRRAALEGLARELGVEESVQFAGVVDDLLQVYDAIDLYVLPSLSEGLGTSLLLAMAHALPVVAAARGGPAEVVADGTNGLLVPDPEPELLAQAVLRLLSDPAGAKRMGEVARRTIESKFTVEQMVDNTLAIYEQVCRKEARG